MSAAHRAGALTKMKAHHAEAVRLREAGDVAGSRAAAKRAEHAADVVKSIDAGAPVGLVDPTKDFSPGYFRSPAAGGAAGGGGAGGGTVVPDRPGYASAGAWEGRYNPENSIDYTNTDPNYWSSVNNYFQNYSSNAMGETGIWIPNLLKEGAGSVGLAAIAGGVRAYEGTNYATGLPGETVGPERSMTIESIFRGGTDAGTGYGGEVLGAMGTIDPTYHGVTMLGGEVTAMPGSDYVRRGGDFGGLLGMGASIDPGLMDALLGPRDSDGMRIRGTFPSPTGAARTDAEAAGMLGGGGGMAGGMGGYPVMSLGTHTGYDSPAAASAFKGYGDAIGFNVGPKGGLVYRPWTMDYWREAGMDPALWGGGGMGGGMSPAYTSGFSPAPASTSVRSPGLSAALASGAPDPARLAAMPGTPGTREGMLPGMHSTHLGAYETSPGVWVWGPEPGREGGSVGEGVGTEGYGIAGHPGSLGGLLGLPADFGSKGFGVMGIAGGLMGMGSPASEISPGADPDGPAGDMYGGEHGGEGDPASGGTGWT